MGKSKGPKPPGLLSSRFIKLLKEHKRRQRKLRRVAMIQGPDLDSFIRPGAADNSFMMILNRRRKLWPYPIPKFVLYRKYRVKYPHIKRQQLDRLSWATMAGEVDIYGEEFLHQQFNTNPLRLNLPKNTPFRGNGDYDAFDEAFNLIVE